jgi:hypothetical protein
MDKEKWIPEKVTISTDQYSGNKNKSIEGIGFLHYHPKSPIITGDWPEIETIEIPIHFAETLIKMFEEKNKQIREKNTNG